MRCKIDIDGNLIVTVESEIEAFALKKFASSYLNNESVFKLVIKPAGAAWTTIEHVINIER